MANGLINSGQNTEESLSMTYDVRPDLGTPYDSFSRAKAPEVLSARVIVFKNGTSPVIGASFRMFLR